MIPLATTTISITRVPVDPSRDGYDQAPAPVAVASGIRAVIAGPSSTVTLAGGDRVVYRYKLTCDPVDLRENDLVTDAAGTVYRCDAANGVSGFGLDHVDAQLRTVEGAA